MIETGMPDRSLSPLKQAFLALEQAQTRVEELERERSEPIAVIGAGCRIPTAKDGLDDGPEDGIEAYWKLLREQKSAVVRRVEERFETRSREGSYPRPRDGRRCSSASMASIRSTSASPRARRRGSIRNRDCCLK